MEAYYHNDPRIEEWVGQIIEKTFSSCLLTGADSDAEFQIGCETVEKLTSLLKGFSTFPSEYLADGLKQIIEQQLPDSRVINNFPAFRDTMEKMLNEGLLKVTGTNSIETNPKGTFAEDDMGESRIEHCNYSDEKSLIDLGFEHGIIVCNEESQNDTNHAKLANLYQEDYEKEFIAIPALATKANDDLEDIRETESDVQNELKFQDGLNASNPVVLNPKDSSWGNESNQVPDEAERLNIVLSYIFPNIPVNWNISVGGHKFLAQVEDLLICSSDQTLDTGKYITDGWKVMRYNEEDLNYPRRLERNINNCIRLRKRGK